MSSFRSFILKWALSNWRDMHFSHADVEYKTVALGLSAPKHPIQVLTSFMP